MPKYTEHFHLEPDELALIERALRREIAQVNRQLDGASAQSVVREVNALLGKLFHQKKFYSHVNKTGVPAG
ncbi:MAG: hypothetical protein ACU84Q_08955 [Gammaproteobacteria bacterium]